MTIVFIADEDDSIRVTTRLILEDAGYTVIDTPNGPAALTILQTSAEQFMVL